MAGFTKPTTTPTPDALFDYWLPRLTGAEMRVLLYAVRRTLGFRKDGDAISRSQFLHGITTTDGRVLDAGTGIKSPNTLSAAITKLELKGLLLKERRKDEEQRDEPSYFRLHIADSPTTVAAYGFKPVNTTPVPDELFDHWLARLTDSELFVLLYVIRRTLGFRKNADAIAVRQFIDGVKTRDGRVLDGGCGVRSFKYLYRALHGLEDKGLLTAEQRVHQRRGSLHTLYRLVFEGDLPFVLSQEQPDPRALPVDNGGVRSPVMATPRDGSIDEDPGAQPLHRGDTIGAVPGAQLVQSGGAISVDPGERIVHRGASAGSYPGSAVNDDGALERLHTQQPVSQETGGQETAQHDTEEQDVSMSKSSNDTATHHVGKTDAGPQPRPLYSALVSQRASDLSLLFHDQDHQRSNRTRALRLWAETGLDERTFAEMMQEARLIAMKRGNIEKDATDSSSAFAGTKNRMPYFFAVLEDLIDMANDTGAEAAPEQEPMAPAPQVSRGRASKYSGGRYGVCPRCGIRPCRCDSSVMHEPEAEWEGDVDEDEDEEP